MPPKDDILTYLIEILSREMPASVLKAWFDDAVITNLTEDTLTLQTSTELKREIIMSRYSQAVTDALFELFGSPMKLEVTLISEQLEKTESPGDRSEFDFDNFVVGDSNKFAAAAARAVAEFPGQAYNPLFIYGGSGLGKTHLLYAIMNYVKASRPEFALRAFSAELFTSDLVDALQNKKMPAFHSKYRTMNVLMVDDIQFIGGKNYSQEEFFHTFNTLYDAGNQIVITSDRPPKDVPALEERLRTRFESGLIVDVQPPDLETRMAIVKSKAKRLGLITPDDVVFYLATSITANVRQLEGSVKKMAAWRDLLHSPVNLDTAEKAIADIMRENPGLNPTPEMIIAEVSSFYGISELDILGKNRQSEIVNARQICMYLVRSLTNMSFNEIGSKVFRRDHSTVLYASEKVAEQRSSDPAFDNDIRFIIENIRGK